MVPNSADADDVFQEVSTELWKKYDQFQPGTDFVAWSIQFAKYAILRFYEKRRRIGQLTFANDVLELIAEDTRDDLPELDRRQQALRTCLQKLPSHSQQLLAARYGTGLKTCGEVAGYLGRSIDSVYKSLNRLHTSLLRCIERTLAMEDRS
ncbi:sigma-70 family RNA polymerase sigma factor [Bremerella sp. JC770]|uniref:sigma-70 family RNA polymerase sigma factor n=1 Tax=Bremerella sp. JC770 TaxID=3232137 RepID=UPI00345B1310